MDELRLAHAKLSVAWLVVPSSQLTVTGTDNGAGDKGAVAEGAADTRDTVNVVDELAVMSVAEAVTSHRAIENVLLVLVGGAPPVLELVAVTVNAIMLEE